VSISIIGVDLAKEVFQVHAAAKDGKKIWSRKLTRSQFKKFLETASPCTVVMEACSGSNYWGRMLRSKGFDVKIIPAQFVKPFVKTNKNDAADAEAIVIAALTPGMRFTEIKTAEQQGVMALHRVRERIVSHKVEIINEIRGFLRDCGITIPVTLNKFKQQIPIILESPSEELSPALRKLIYQLMEEFTYVEARISTYDKEVKEIYENKEICQRLGKIEGVGPITATAVFASVASPGAYKNGRALAASFGLVPRHVGSGGKTTMLGISRRGDPYVRSLLIHGARSVLSLAMKRSDTRSLKLQRLKARIGFNKACVAIANRNARVIWVLMAKGEEYRPE